MPQAPLRDPASLKGRWLLRWLVFVGAAGFLGSASGTAPQEDVGARAWSHVSTLAGLGPRVAGTAAERRAVEYVAGHLRALGYHVRVVDFPFPYFEVRQVVLEITQPRRMQIPVRALIFSPPTDGPLEASVVVVGRGMEEEFQQVDVRGRVALVERGGISFLQKAENAAHAGARAVVIYNHEPGLVVGTLTRPSAIPAVTISREDGLRLKALAEQQTVVVSLVVDTALHTRGSWNVLGQLPGRSGARVMLGAHVDSVEGSPGANDNASGVATALEAARLLARRPPGWSVEVAGFGAEEGGLFGSAALAQRVAGLTAMLNLDMVGVGPRLLVGRTGSDPRVVEAVQLAARGLGIRVEARRMGSSDHVSFEGAGVPAAMLHRPGDPHYHSPHDTADKVRPELLEQVVWLAAEALHYPALVTSRTPVGASRPRGRL